MRTATRTAPPPPRALLWRVLAWTGVLLIAGLTAMVWMQGRSAMAGALATFLVAGVVIMRLPERLPGFFKLLLVLIALLNGAGGAFDWFDTVVWFDELVHTYSGSAGLCAIGYLYALDHPHRRATLVWWCVGMGLVLGIGWEVLEGLVGDLEFWDTASDIVLDTVGAALGGLFARQALLRAEQR